MRSRVVSNSQLFALVEECVANHQPVRLPLQGKSMLPALHAGDVLTLSPLDEDPVVGDVVLFRYRGKYLLHRVVAVVGDSYRMQGDNCCTGEEVGRDGIVARLTSVQVASGKELPTDGRRWRRRSRWSVGWRRMRCAAVRWLGRKGRGQLRPWYFVVLAFLMWAPLNGVGIALDNYIFGIRTDHLLHASVFVPCTLFLVDVEWLRSWRVWLAAAGVGLLCEGVQYLLPYRGFDVNDLVANVLGVSLGWVALLLIRGAVRRRRAG